MNAQIPINYQNPTTPIFWLNAPVAMNQPDPFGGWTAQDETVEHEMRPSVPGLTSS